MFARKIGSIKELSPKRRRNVFCRKTSKKRRDNRLIAWFLIKKTKGKTFISPPREAKNARNTVGRNTCFRDLRRSDFNYQRITIFTKLPSQFVDTTCFKFVCPHFHALVTMRPSSPPLPMQRLDLTVDCSSSHKYFAKQNLCGSPILCNTVEFGRRL